MMEVYSTVAAERRYQNVNGHYQLPNDSNEHRRLDGQSRSLIALMNNRPFHASFTTPPKKIIDIGCGTGAMTVLLASAYPNAQVIGVDVSPVPAYDQPLPSNVEFVQGDIDDLIRDGNDPRLESGSFDYVFQRLLVLGVVDWPGHIKRVTSLLKPGGWLEAQEVDMNLRTATGDDVAHKWWHSPLLLEDARAVGLDPNIGPKLEDYMSAAGLSKIKTDLFHIPAVSLPDRPELDGIGNNLTLLFLVLQSKVSTPRRSTEDCEKMGASIKAMFGQDGIETHMFNLHAVAGQRV